MLSTSSSSNLYDYSFCTTIQSTLYNLSNTNFLKIFKNKLKSFFSWFTSIAAVNWPYDMKTAAQWPKMCSRFVLFWLRDWNDSSCSREKRFLEEMPIILITSVELKTYIKGHFVHHEIWNSKLGEEWNVHIDKRVCWNRNFVEHLKGRSTFYFLRSDSYLNFLAEVSGKIYAIWRMKKGGCKSLIIYINRTKDLWSFKTRLQR